MPTRIYLIRHGESQANEKNMFIGHTDMALTRRGQEQARIAAQYLKDIRPDAVYSSDLQRAYHTALAVAEPLGMTVIRDPDLREIYAGQWEGVPFDVLQTARKEAYDVWLNDVAHVRCEGGESVPEVMERVTGAVRRIALAHENQVVFIFSHGTPIRAMAVHAMGKTVDELEVLPWPSNASVTELEFDGKEFRLLRYSEDGFMGDLVTKLPDNV